MTDQIEHPGRYIRKSVIPLGMSVTEAAKLLDVSRPTLSNLLNGNADLSTEMAARLEAAFGIPARQLLDLQSRWDAAHASRAKLAPTIKSYVPPFLQIKAARIEAWAAGGLKPRQRLAVFLRTLVNSTGAGLTKVDFPGNDDSERAGWDGEVEATEPTPWIPTGLSGWEFGVTEEVKKKADGDFAKSVIAVEAAQRKLITFVFVTPRGWPGKGAWIKEHRAKKLWKDVRAYDASDLEQWLEQSIPGQAWFANETVQAAQGAISLDEAWKIWKADTELSPALFGEALSSYKSTLTRSLAGPPYNATIITADSKDEALAFLSAAFAAEDPELGPYRDRIVVFRDPGSLSKLASQVSNFIPVILSREVEKEFAPFRANMPSFIIYPRNASSSEPEIALETLSYEAFDEALRATGVDDDRIKQLSRESARSPTVLRRRLSALPAIRTPDWASDKELAAALIPFLFAGAWKAGSKADEAMLEALAGDVPFDELERRLAELRLLDSAPVWSIGAFRGVVSKIDILFAIKDFITTADLTRFFEVADIVLSEPNPALDLPEERRWAAAIYGKTREISGALRDGLAESLVLLAVHGPSLLKARLNFDPALQAEHLVEGLLTPLTASTLESQTDNLPLYAEAAPRKFICILESDLATDDPQSLALMRPVGEFPFGTAPRTGLLWALENLAWLDELFMRTVLVLGRLAEKVVDDNLTNKASGSLSSIFRSWMPQTSAKLEQRKAALSKLVERYPAVAWRICLEQFSPHSRVGHYSHKPRWRPDGHGQGNPLVGPEANEFAAFAFDLTLNWKSHTSDTISGLISHLNGLDESRKVQVWDLVDEWSKTADDAEKAQVREKIRVTTMTRGARLRRGKREPVGSDERARLTFARLEPSDPIMRHEWLFRQAWVDESADELAEQDFSFEAREARTAELRREAIREVFECGGLNGVLRLAESGQAGAAAGWALATVVSDLSKLMDAIVELASGGEISGARASLISGALWSAVESSPEVLLSIVRRLAPETGISVLRLAQFNRQTWDAVEALGDGYDAGYWGEVQPFWNRNPTEFVFAIDKLVQACRPRAAFQLAQLELKELPPRSLFELISAVGTGSSEPSGAYLLDRYHLREAFKLLNDSGEFKTDELAGLEFQFIDIFDEDGSQPVNLEHWIASEPELFVQAVVFAFRRADGGEDPLELRPKDDEQRSARGSSAYTLLDKLTVIPGTENGIVNRDKLRKWISDVRERCGELARQDIGDQTIGKLLSHAPKDEEGVWPCPPVRDVLEEVMTEHIGVGIEVALHNSRGVHWRGEGGEAERALAAKYAGWAESMEYTHPRVAAVLRNLEQSYLRQADWEDSDAKIARRMRY